MPLVAAPESVSLASLSDLRLPDDDGHERRVGDAWKDRPAVIAFLRHFG